MPSQRAFELVTSPQVKAAFDLDREPIDAARPLRPSIRGARRRLLARRLVEAGVTFVTINHYEADVDWWDDHYTIEKNLRQRLPLYDQALAALIEDLHDRGLAERVLVVACGEFGRGPRIDKLAGRGHWAEAMTRPAERRRHQGGQVVGATTANGGEPRDRPARPGRPAGDDLSRAGHRPGDDAAGPAEPADPPGRSGAHRGVVLSNFHTSRIA